MGLQILLTSSLHGVPLHKGNSQQHMVKTNDLQWIPEYSTTSTTAYASHNITHLRTVGQIQLNSTCSVSILSLQEQHHNTTCFCSFQDKAQIYFTYHYSYRYHVAAALLFILRTIQVEKTRVAFHSFRQSKRSFPKSQYWLQAVIRRNQIPLCCSSLKGAPTTHPFCLDSLKLCYYCLLCYVCNVTAMKCRCAFLSLIPFLGHYLQNTASVAGSVYTHHWKTCKQQLHSTQFAPALTAVPKPTKKTTSAIQHPQHTQQGLVTTLCLPYTPSRPITYQCLWIPHPFLTG